MRQGVAVIPLFTADEIKVYHQELVATILAHTPELKQPIFRETTPLMASNKKRTRQDDQADAAAAANSILVDGGFGALALASSFHNTVVRRLRTEMTTRTRDFFIRFIAALSPNQQGQQLRLEQLLDRFSIRRVGTATTAESWHRDQSPRRPNETPDDMDTVLGGWLNLDLAGGIQHFSCQPRTHQLPRGSTGFAPLTPEQAAAAKLGKQTFDIPPGHWCIFYQNLVHEVYPSVSKYDSMRLYFGWRITSSQLPLFEECAQDKLVLREFKGGIPDWRQMVFTEQGVPPIPSGQKPRMFSKMSLAFRKPKLSQWAKNELDPRLVLTAPHKTTNVVETLPLVHCPSLAAAGFPLFPAYSAAEIAQHTPQILA